MSLRKLYHSLNPDLQDSKGNTPLMRAIEKDNADRVHYLLFEAEKSANVNIKNKNDETALYLAAIRGNNAIVDDLLRAGADVNSIKFTPMYSVRGQEFISSTPLCVAASGGHVDIVRKLLDAKADVNKKEGNPLLDVASCGGLDVEICNQIVEILLAAGANPDVRDDAGSSALSYAVQGRTKVLEMLVQAGADVNIRNEPDNSTALMWAAHYGHEEMVDILIKAGADVNLQTRSLKTALTMAMFGDRNDSNPEVVERIANKLIEAGTDIHARDKADKSALDYAIQHQLVSTVELLVEKGAKKEPEKKDEKQAEIEAILRSANVQCTSNDKGYLGNAGTFKKSAKSREKKMDDTHKKDHSPKNH